MKVLDDKNFEQINEDLFCIVDFWATWCGPCRQINGSLEEINKEGINVYKLNIDENKESVSKYKITSIPTLIFFKNGKEMDRLIGTKSKNEIKNIAKKINFEDGVIENE